MPLGALVEVEAIAATHEAASCLEIQDSFSRRVCPAIENPEDEIEATNGWDTGHDFQVDDDKGAVGPELQFDVMIRSLGNGSAACAIVTAGTSGISDIDMDIDIEIVLATMLKHASDAIKYGTSGMGLANVMNVRLYYVATRLDDSGDFVVENDGIRIRSAFQTAVASQWQEAKDAPATTLVPVQGMKVIRHEVTKEDDSCTLFAMQLTILDPVHMESELWIRHGREEE
jgi:hypothetical protein